MQDSVEVRARRRAECVAGAVRGRDENALADAVMSVLQVRDILFVLELKRYPRSSPPARTSRQHLTPRRRQY